LMRGATAPKPVRAVEKILLVNGLQHHRHRALQDLVLEGRDALRILLPVLRMGLGMSSTLRTIAAGPGCLEALDRRSIELKPEGTAQSAPLDALEPAPLNPVADDVLGNVQARSDPVDGVEAIEALIGPAYRGRRGVRAADVMAPPDPADRVPAP